MRKIWKIVTGFLAVTGALTLLVLLGIAYGITHIADATPSLPKQIVLDIDLNQGIVDQPSAHDTLEKFTRTHGPLHLQDAIEALEQASADARVKALNIRLGSSGLEMAQAQELRAAILKFSASGKFVQAYADSFGEMGGGTVDAYLASAASEIWMQPSGDMGLIGFSAEMPFARGSLDLLGIKPEFQRRHEYKSAVESFTEKTMTPEARASLKSLLDSWLEQVVAGISEGRKLAPEAVRQLIDQAPLSADEAMAAHLIDKLGYEDEADDALDKRYPEAEPVDIADFLQDVGSPHGKGKHKIAVIHAQGPVVGGSDSQPFGGRSSVIAAEDVLSALADAMDDKEVVAIILRIDSPGGSYLASDTIWRGVKKAREGGKPVIASIGPMAASGGYFIAMGTDRILAEPGSITGSIGVFAGKLVITDFLAKLGLAFDEVDAGANAGLLSMNRPFSPEQNAKMTAMLDRIYADFTTKAGDGRKLDAEAMDRVARGRVFTGSQALKAGLIDELGGLESAILAAKKAAKLADETPVRLVYLPKPLSQLEKLASLLEGGNLPLGIHALARVGLKLDAALERLGLIEARENARLAPVNFSH
ncbi:MAG: signal peptide peptidase SppA [Alphaproteobacteria bacterium]|nr:signal peptide peptidase SppA [Alphaproteobacteria bacterium]